MKNIVTKQRVFNVLTAGALVLGGLALGGCSSCSSQAPAGQSAASTTSATTSAASSTNSDVAPKSDQMEKIDQNTKLTVPNAISLTQADAEKVIVASGLRLGTVTTKPSDSVPVGCVISQEPKALSSVKANSTVNLVISSGKEKAKEIKVPDLKGLGKDEAKKRLTDLGLVAVAASPERTDAVAPGKVFKQSIAAGTTVAEGTKVIYTVALAPEKAQQATVPNVTGKTRDEAKSAIAKAKLSFDYTEAYSNNVAKGKVITQSIPAGTKVTPGTTVSVTVSLGAKPASNVKVPNVMSYTWTDAESTLRSAGLTARYTGDPAGIVVAQDVAAGTEVAPNTLVTVTLASPVKMVTVPDLVGLSVTSAEMATDEVGLALETNGMFHGTVTEQWPAAGTLVEERTTVTVTIDDSDFRMVAVPDLVGLSVASAEIEAENANFKLEIDEGGIHGTVDSQTPEAGELVDPNTTIHITVDDSDFRGQSDEEGTEEAVVDEVAPEPEETADDNKEVVFEDGPAEFGDANTKTVDDYKGTWQCDRATLTIAPAQDGETVFCTIEWGSSAFESAVWKYTCTLKDGKLVDGGKGVQMTTAYDTDGELASTNTVYTNGSAEFVLGDNGAITWNDSTGNAGAGMSFSKIG